MVTNVFLSDSNKRDSVLWTVRLAFNKSILKILNIREINAKKTKNSIPRIIELIIWPRTSANFI